MIEFIGGATLGTMFFARIKSGIKWGIAVYLVIGVIIWSYLFVAEYRELANGRDNLLFRYDICESNNYKGAFVIYAYNFTSAFIDELSPNQKYSRVDSCLLYNKSKRHPDRIKIGDYDYDARRCVWTDQGASVGKGDICGDYKFWSEYSPLKDTIEIEKQRLWIILGWPFLILVAWAMSGVMR